MTPENDLNQLVKELNKKQDQISQNLSFSHRQLQNLAKRVWRVQEDERKHIARELHDGVGQLLTALINQLQPMEHYYPGEEYNNLMQLAKDALADTREISRLMRPRILDDLGLVPALEWLGRVMSEKNDMTINLLPKINCELDDESSTLAFRVIQEALTNAIKHANCQTIDILIIATEQLMVIKVKDDGVGIKPNAQNDQSSFGLKAMQDRITAFGGSLEITALHDGGTELKVTLIGRRDL